MCARYSVCEEGKGEYQETTTSVFESPLSLSPEIKKLENKKHCTRTSKIQVLEQREFVALRKITRDVKANTTVDYWEPADLAVSTG